MLGGFESISRTDIQGSKSFFAKLKLPRGTPPLRIADCGAGFGPLPLASSHLSTASRVSGD